MTKCSIVMMSWERPENINKILLIYQEYNCIDEIIIWNNHPHFYISNLNLSKVKVLNSSTDFGLNTRFIGALLATNRCIITHDDDILLSEINIKNLIMHFERDYTRIYTYEGRIPQDGIYTCAPGPGRIEDVKEATEVDVVLTRTTCFDKMYAAEYCKLSDVVFYDVNTNLNGEDIVFSYITSNLSGKKPIVLPIPDKNGYIELPAPINTKISTRPNFIERRTNLINRCKLLFPTPQYPTPDNNQTIFFGNGFYPYAYYKDSFVVNSEYKKLLIKDDLNGIKYLSCNTTDKYDWTIFYVDTNVLIKNTDNIIIRGFFKNRAIPLDIELNFLHQNEEKNTNRIRSPIAENFVSEHKILIKDYIDCKEDTMLTSLKFILYTKNRPCSELCLTELLIRHEK
jgi:hypothetical protein